jgi:endonuclease-3
LSASRSNTAARVAALLRQCYPDAALALRYSSPLELLVAVILSAQCTDARVNDVTARLFRKYRHARDYAAADPAQLEEEIRPTGFYRNKAKLLMNCCRQLVERFGGEVPRTIEELVTLPGVGRKTANMVLGNAFGIPGIAVDTHVLRVANRLGLVSSDDPEEVEKALAAQLPRTSWTGFSNAMILHGREICVARTPRCESCLLADLCPGKMRVA